MGRCKPPIVASGISLIGSMTLRTWRSHYSVSIHNTLIFTFLPTFLRLLSLSRGIAIDEATRVGCRLSYNILVF